MTGVTGVVSGFSRTHDTILSFSRTFDTVYQSRSGRPEDPWLGPDVCEYLREQRARGLEAALLCPAGFLCDHVEVLYDLDVEAADIAREIGLPMVRAQAVNDHPRFLDMICRVVLDTYHAVRHSTRSRSSRAETTFLGACASKSATAAQPIGA